MAAAAGARLLPAGPLAPGWLGRNNAVVMAVLFLVFAVVLIGKGIAAV